LTDNQQLEAVKLPGNKNVNKTGAISQIAPLKSEIKPDFETICPSTDKILLRNFDEKKK